MHRHHYEYEVANVNILFFLTPKSEVAYIFENETLRQTVEKMEHRKFSCIPILSLDGKYTGTISEGDLLWGIKRLGVNDIKEMESIPIMAIPRRATYKPVHASSKMEDLLDRMQLPQSFTAARSFAPAPRHRADSPPDQSPQEGKLGTFSIRVIFRQNASWQGSVTWLEGGRDESFRSVLELLLLMHSALETEQD